ncbi:hypothetical protein BX600DRAFT_316131 [Xylariales sp. PMI_506]|nr:hypothetical protein BX600DRAFT_316131 [Xylariales sp. PMI_506]
MGNVPSAEVSGMERRNTHKLSKPQKANRTSSGTVASHGGSDPQIPMRTMSLPASASVLLPTLPIPPIPSTPARHDRFSLISDASERPARSRSVSRVAGAIFRSKSSVALRRTLSRKEDHEGNTGATRGSRQSKTDSTCFEYPDSTYYGVTASRQAPGLRNSVNYDLNSYQAKRLLNINDEAMYDQHSSLLSENQFHIADAKYRDTRAEPVVETARTVALSRVKSEPVLCPPMRRRASVQVPGIATRRPKTPPLPHTGLNGYHRLVTDFTGEEFDLPPPRVDPDSGIRVVTPCDEDYRHIGAFKLGSLRITNGSPVRSPIVNESKTPTRLQKQDYFQQKKEARPVMKSSRSPDNCHLQTRRDNSPRDSFFVDNKSQEDSQAATSSGDISIRSRSKDRTVDGTYSGRLEAEQQDPGLQYSSNLHRSWPDTPFEFGLQEFTQPEVLDVRIDISAKGLPPRPKLISEGRTDSGIAVPTFEKAPKPLAKTDSGYSSKNSLDLASPKPPVPEKDRQLATLKRKSSQVALFKTNGDDESTKQTDQITAILGRGAAQSRTNHPLPPPVPQKDTIQPLSSSKATPSLRPRHQEMWRTTHLSLKPILLRVPKKLKARANHEPSHSRSQSMTTTSSNSLLSSSRSHQKLTSLKPAYNKGSPAVSDAAKRFEKPTGLENSSASSLKPSPRSSYPVMRFLSDFEPYKETKEQNIRRANTEGSSILRNGQEAASRALEHVSSKQGGQWEASAHEPHAEPLKNARRWTHSPDLSSRKPITRKPVATKVTALSARVSSDRMLGAVGVALSTEDHQPPLSSRSTGIEVEGRDSVMNAIGQANSQPPAYPKQDFKSKHSLGDSKETAITSDGIVPSSSFRLGTTSLTHTRGSMRTRNSPSLTQMGSTKAFDPSSRNDGGQRRLINRSFNRGHIYSYPASVDSWLQQSVSTRPSREDIRSYPPAMEHHSSERQMAALSELLAAQPGPESEPNLEPEPAALSPRSFTFTTETGTKHRRPNWEVATDHDDSLRRSSYEYNGEDWAVTASSSNGGQHRTGIPWLAPRPYYSTGPAPQQIRHRASCDSLVAVRRSPSPKAAAGTLLVDQRHDGDARKRPASSGSRAGSPSDWAEHWATLPRQYEVHHTSGSSGSGDRSGGVDGHGHARNRSLGAYGTAPPYRVLHSYNSPAYRNMPIWS